MPGTKARDTGAAKAGPYAAVPRLTIAEWAEFVEPVPSKDAGMMSDGPTCAGRRAGECRLPHRSLVLRRMVDEEQAMTLNWKRHAALAAFAGWALMAGSVAAQEVPLVTGEHWTRSTEQVKRVYLIGIANAIQVEVAYEGANPPSDAQSIVPRMAKGLRGQTLDGVREGLDNWYAKNPDRLQRPVIETIWFEMVVPGLRKAQ